MRRGGFVLPVALVVMVAVSLLALTTLQVAMNDFQANRSWRLASRALYAAEAGADLTLARWSSGPFAALTPGDSASTGWLSLPDGSLYRSTVLRVDDGSAPTPLFRVVVDGRPGRRATARRQIIVMVEAAGGGGCCDAAIKIRGDLIVRPPRAPRRVRDWEPPTQVDGRDHIPAIWAGYCPALSGTIPGVRIDDERNLDLQRNAVVEGSPEVLEDPTLDGSVADVLGSNGYAQLAAGADIVYDARNERLRGTIEPSVRRGECDTSDPQNWGAPGTPGSRCWDYLPVIHAEGNLTIDADGEGQGLLLVDGDLTMDAAFDFYGVIVVKGELTVRGEATVTGGVIVANRDNGRGRSDVREDAFVRYSSCAAARSTGGMGVARFLPGRHWFEVP